MKHGVCALDTVFASEGTKVAVPAHCVVQAHSRRGKTSLVRDASLCVQKTVPLTTGSQTDG